MTNKMVEEKLSVARIAMLWGMPFYGNMVSRLKMIEDETIGTAATNGKVIKYNPKFIEGLSEKECIFVLAHEALHVVYEHLWRTGPDMKPNVSNMAADHVVNLELKEQGIGSVPRLDLCMDPKYHGWTFEEVYADLIANGADEESGDSFDGHDPGDDMTEEEKASLRQDIKEAVVAAAEAAGPGNIPAGVQRIIDQWCRPKVSWKDVLHQNLTNSIKRRSTWSRLNKKGQGTNVMLQGRKRLNKIDVCIAIDTSGSITSEMIVQFLSEVKGITDSFDEYQLNVWCFDTMVHNHQVFDCYNTDISTYKPMGGGGTSFASNWKYMKENEIEPKVLIMFTDMESYDGFGDPDYCDTIFIAVNSSAVAPHGITIGYDL